MAKRKPTQQEHTPEDPSDFDQRRPPHVDAILDPVVLSVDTGKTMGWSLITKDRAWSGLYYNMHLMETGDRFNEFMAELPVSPTHLCVEDAYKEGGDYKSRRPGWQDIYYGLHSRRVGYIVGSVRALHRKCQVIWLPKPATWRKEVRNAGFRIAHAPRKMCKETAVRGARELGFRCSGPMGGRRHDEAEAIMMGVAMAQHYRIRPVQDYLKSRLDEHQEAARKAWKKKETYPAEKLEETYKGREECSSKPYPDSQWGEHR